jgi:chromosome segregation ATPase
MEDTFVWILVFAGATIGLLGTFLISSERELKRKRREVEEFAAKLKHGESAPAFEETTPAPAGDTEQTTELIARNKELEDEVDSLSSRLRLSETANEELAAVQHQLSASRLENTELQKSNQQLQDEIALLKNQLDVNLSQLSQSGDEHQQTAARATRYETENADLRSKLEQSRCKIEALESRQAQWAEIESRESLMKEQQQRLEVEITELNKQLTAAREAVHEIAATQAQLRESESSRKQLVDDNQRLQQEISRWQERLADSEEQRRRLSTFRHNLEELRIKQAAVIETNRQLQDELDALARFIETPESAGDVGLSLSETASPPDAQDSFGNELNGRGVTAEPPQLDSASSASLADESTNTSAAKRRRFGIFPAIVALTIGGSVTAGFLG